MNEKQRWLLRDLEAWHEKQMERIGKYGPKKELPEPRAVRQARVMRNRATKVIDKWERKEKKAPWQRQKDVIDQRAQSVKRAILFEKTATALAAIRSLK